MTITTPTRAEAQTRQQNDRIGRIVNIVGGSVQSVHVEGGVATAIIEDGLPRFGEAECEYKVTIAGDGSIEDWQERFTASGIKTLEGDGIANPHRLADWYDNPESLTRAAATEQPF
ncbi:hypothetical protein GCM10025867_49340 (plasmid) [Frondihabitans sucicola]|uniref:Uncharacterized protein n=1 Tax=Frondihabitans sucicola TaxID=1268041 RepID=A0ABN6Y687_9MICO|nr:hypothetical protein [Frondihabitans sucicola]BDZ52693.1 hypothetical protein GCM10025867_49340 [Frondihabitans sucicola]